MTKTEYEVRDEHGPYGVYPDRMSAMLAVNKILQRGGDPELREVTYKKVDWERDLRDLFGGPDGM